MKYNYEGMRRRSCLLLVGWILSSACLAARTADYVPVHNPGSREALLDVSFQPGVTHVGGNYRFSDRNYLLEGATRAERLGTKAIFVYLTSNFRAEYPDPGTGLWPQQDPNSMVNLIQTRPYQMLLSMPFKTFVLTGLSFVNGTAFESLAPGWEQREEDECYELAKYLLKTYSGQGKTFILKNHETDWHSPDRTNPDGSYADLNKKEADVVRKWFSARQRGVNRARAWAATQTERPPIQGVAVYHAAEVNLVVEAGEGRRRVLNLVIGRMRRPDPEPDMVSYSAHDSAITFTPGETFDKVSQALRTIDQYAPDPLGLGAKRIFISEFGLYENEEASGTPGTVERTNAILQASERFGIPYAFHWEIFDNECRDPFDPSGERWVGDLGPEGVAIGLGEARRPSNRHCRGLWLIRPDGSAGEALRPLLNRWSLNCPLRGLGDLNCDGAIDQKDADLLAQMISGRASSKPYADFNGDGVVDVRDLAVIQMNRTDGAVPNQLVLDVLNSEVTRGALQVKVGPQEDVFKPYSYGLTDFPDGLFGVFKKDGTYYWFIGSFPPNYKWGEDTPVTYLFRFVGTDLNKMKPDPIDKKGNAVKVLSPGSHGTYDDHIAGNGSVYFDEKTNKLYFWYQAMRTIPEDSSRRKVEKLGEENVYAAYGGVGLAVSEDLGKTWRKTGSVLLTPNITYEKFVDDSSIGTVDLYPPSVIKNGEFFYMYYNDYGPPSYAPFQVTVARLLVSELDKNPQPWKKYYNGEFTEPALGGKFSKIIGEDESTEFSGTEFVAVSFNTYLNQWIMLHQTYENDGRWTFGLRTSKDGLTWSAAQQIVKAPTTKDWIMAPTIISTGDAPAVTGQEFWIYYSLAPNKRANPGGWMVRRKVRLD